MQLVVAKYRQVSLSFLPPAEGYPLEAYKQVKDSGVRIPIDFRKMVRQDGQIWDSKK